MIELHWLNAESHTTLPKRGCGVRLEISYSRGLTILKGAVPGRVRGSGHMAPTYFCRFPGSKIPTAIAAPRFLIDLHLPSFRGVCEAYEPGIQDRMLCLDSGPASFSRVPE